MVEVSMKLIKDLHANRTTELQRAHFYMKNQTFSIGRIWSLDLESIRIKPEHKFGDYEDRYGISCTHENRSEELLKYYIGDIVKLVFNIDHIHTFYGDDYTDYSVFGKLISISKV